MKGANATYWQNVREGFQSLSGGLVLSWKHFKDALFKKGRTSVGVESDNYFEHQNGIFTNYYPHESLPIPDNGRYRLHNEIDDCIVCDKCAKVCPVDCIDIEAIKSPTEIRKASDGSSIRLHAAKFDIDMAKCCYCGLCTTVCPTECLTMTKTFDYSEVDIRDMVYQFSKMTEEEAVEKQKEYDDYMAAKKAKSSTDSETSTRSIVTKPKVVIPGAKSGSVKPKVVIPGTKTGATPKPKIPGVGVLKPKITPKPKEGEEQKPSALKPKIGGAQPKTLKPEIKKVDNEGDSPKPSPLKPVIKKPSSDEEKKPSALKPVIKKPSALKPVVKKASPLKPVIKPKPPKKDEE